MNADGFLPVLAALALAPLLFGIINKVKALFAGRQGPPVLQLYYDLLKLSRKGAVYSATTSWLFRAGPVVGVAAVTAALLLVPLGGTPAVFAFRGDFILALYLLGVARFFLVAAAMDTGSAFEGMGASREVFFSALAEPALFVVLAALAHGTQAGSLSDMLRRVTPDLWQADMPSLALLLIALVLVLLAENARIPVDDPNTHLELTMIHEVMVLDHGGPDFALVLYASALKLWLFAALVVGVLPIHGGPPAAGLAASLAAMAMVAALVGAVESAMARLRLARVPQLLLGAAALALVGFLLLAAG